ncbi:MAG: metallophosphoesterase [Sphaerobacter sp.]|nr:metallophosphoesterase [Sphaerobacter sp.]
MKRMLAVIGSLVALLLGLVGARMVLTAATAPSGAAVGVAGPTAAITPPKATTLLATGAPATPGSLVTAPGAPVLVGAGDTADCGEPHDEASAALLDGIAGTVFTTGDNAYQDGSAAEFAECYGPSWGRHRDRTRPAPGNHDYRTRDGAAYYDYFGAAAGDPGKGYYSYDLGTWHIVVINSNCGDVGCDEGSAQEQWLRADLAQHPATCTLAYWHHPRFSSGKHGSQSKMQAIWEALYDAGADVVLTGHDHNYQRFAPLNARGEVDPEQGIRQFVVGTGGKNLYQIDEPLATTEVYNDDTFGVLRLTLHERSYDWEFIPVAGGTFSDSGSAECHP